MRRGKKALINLVPLKGGRYSCSHFIKAEVEGERYNKKHCWWKLVVKAVMHTCPLKFPATRMRKIS